MAFPYPTQDENDARTKVLMRVFTLFNRATPDQAFRRIDLFGDGKEQPRPRVRWSADVLRLLRAAGFIGRKGNGYNTEYYRQRLLPVDDDRLVQLCLSPGPALMLIKQGNLDISSGPPSFSVVPDIDDDDDGDDGDGEPADPVYTDDDIDSDDSEFEHDGDGALDGDDGDAEPQDVDEDTAALSLPDDFDPRLALLEVLQSVRRINSRMTVIEHRQMETQTQLDDLLREWTGAK